MATPGVDALGLEGRESAGDTADNADTASILANNALARDNAVLSRRGISRRVISGRSISRRSIGRRSIGRGLLSRRLLGGWATNNGSLTALAVLSNSKLLEHGLSLLRGRVDGEDHALSTVVALSAVEPCEMVRSWISKMIRRQKN